jgi:pre-mRNA-splicing factor ISY1
VALERARLAAAYITFLDPKALLPPKMPTREQMEGALLQLRKKALVQEYFGNE